MKYIKKIDIKTTIDYLKIQKEDFKLLINIMICIFISVTIFLSIEWIHRGSVQVLNFISDYPSAVLLNYNILLLVVSPALLSKRVCFLTVLLGIPYIILAEVSKLLIEFRGVPLTWADFYSLGEGLAIANQYLSKEHIKRGCAGILITLLILSVGFFISFKNYKVRFGKRMIVLMAISAILLLERDYLTRGEAADKMAGDLKSMYQRNGFLYSFIDSYIDSFREKAEGYSYNTVKEVVGTINKDTSYATGQSDVNEKSTSETEPVVKPNIIMVQTEAFFDPTMIKGTEFNEDPIPCFRKYFNEGYSGALQVPTIGGATARTEFEVLTGVNIDYLSAGEIPYNSGLTSKEPIETIAYVLKKKGYQTTAIHNFQGNFYGRDKAFKNLGFDRFIPMESMIGLVKYRPFPEDHILLTYIKRVLDESEKEDFIFTITAGTHGPYSTTPKPGNQKYISGDLKSSTLFQLQNYTSLIRRTDKFIGELAEYIYSLQEPTVLIVYSDHNPKLEAVDSLGEAQRFNTPYFIIDNQNKLPKSKENNIEAYQLSTDIFNLNHLKGGVMNDFHTAFKNSENYQTELQLMQYDILFGKKYATNNQNPYYPTTIQIGLDKLEILEAEWLDKDVMIRGNGFTESSKIFLDDKLIETEFVDSHTLIGKKATDTSESVQVKQIGRYDMPLISSNIIFFKNYKRNTSY
ncbi:MAG: putative rane protein [Clostridia bacterium]|jgi:phosphoglycerol transferase MdoB-like AlkP superfamily enzyme|nr:putative rane protein [Clostridia bacterium]